MAFSGLPASGATAEYLGTVIPVTDASVLSLKVAEAEALQLRFPGDYSGLTLAQVEVTTPEGTVIRSLSITVTPVADVVIDGEILENETDLPVTFVISDFVDVLITDPTEMLTGLVFTLPGLPVGTTSNSGTLTTDDGGTPGDPSDDTVTFVFDTSVDSADPTTVSLTLPRDYSTTSPLVELKATLEVETDQTLGTPVVGEIYATVDFEGDVIIEGTAPADLEETDLPVDFKPSDFRVPRVDPSNPVDDTEDLDQDGSESIDYVTLNYDEFPPGVTFTGVPANTVTYDNVSGGAFAFSGTEAEYFALIITFPTDFSTESRSDGFPNGPIAGNLSAFTDEAGVAVSELDISIGAEGDIELVGPGFLTLDENDPPNPPVSDADNTTTAPVTFKPADAVTARATDADQSETVAEVDISISGLPVGSAVSIDGGGTFTSISGGYAATGLSLGEYEDLVFMLPDDYSTTNPGNNDAGPIVGDVTFKTDEALLSNETGNDLDDGIQSTTFTVTVEDEADVAIQAQDLYERVEDQWTSIPLDLDATAVDVDSSEQIVEPVKVRFAGLPAGGMEIAYDVGGSLTTDVLTPGSNEWSGTVASLQTLTITDLPEHYSGIITGTVNVVTDEGTTTGSEKGFEIRITPVAEPTINLSVVPNGTIVREYAPDQFSVKEDNSFLLSIDASTPDMDGSEALTQIVIENVPPVWLPDGDVSGFFQLPYADVQSATKSGSVITIQFVTSPAVTSFANQLELTPGPEHTDEDVATIIGSDLIATVTSVDAPAGLPSDTATANDSTDVDIDAVADGLTIETSPQSSNEQLDVNKLKNVSLGIDRLELEDQDGSETFTSSGTARGGIELVLTVATESDNFDPGNTNQLQLRVQDSALRPYASITQVSSTADTVTYRVDPAGLATNQQFIDAVESLQVRLPAKFSGVITNDGTAYWTETTTPDTKPGDVERDETDNQGTASFTSEVEIRPRAEAELTFSAFVRPDDQTAIDVPTGEVTSITGTALSGESIEVGVLTLLESTLDGSGPDGPDGQVELYLGIDASTPDVDGSEELVTLVLENVPTDWVADFVSGTNVDLAILRSADGSTALTPSEADKVDRIEFNASNGQLTVFFKPDAIEFNASLLLTPTPYEDYDVDGQNKLPLFTSVGDFFPDDLKMTLNTLDDNTRQTSTNSADAKLDVDVDPVNNKSFIVTLPDGNEAVIDSTNTGQGGTWDIPIILGRSDQDGTETISALVIRSLPQSVSVYVPTQPLNPDGNYQPALITSVNPDGTVDWSLQNQEWENAQLRGIPLHYAGDYPITLEVVTTEFDGKGTDTTTLNVNLRVDPVADGGDPSETESGLEDSAILVVLDGNIIDQTPESPEAVLRGFLITNVQPDSFGREPRFFDGLPVPDPSAASGFSNEIFLLNGSVLILPSVASQLYVVPGQDSNETVTFDITGEYYETIDLTEFTIGKGTVTIDVKGVADPATIIAQQEDPDLTTGVPVIAKSDVNAEYRPDNDDTDGDGSSDGSNVDNYNRIYGYAGNDNGPFLLDKRLTNDALELGAAEAANQGKAVYETATSLDGDKSEILVTYPDSSVDFDPSEALYFVISGLTPGVTLTGGTPVDPTGETYLVTQFQLPNIAFVPEAITVVTYYDLDLNTIVVEDDADLQAFVDALPQSQQPGNPGFDLEDFLTEIDKLDGVDVQQEGFTVVVVPEDGDGGTPCPPDELELPILSLEGPLVEDEQGSLKLVLTSNAQYQTLGDLLTLPLGISGDLGIAIDLPSGSSLSSSPAGAVLYDPVTGKWAIDLEKLIGTNTNDTVSEGSLLFTPPPHQSSPTNPFPVDETFGDLDDAGGYRYDELDSLDYTIILNNITCGTVTAADRSFAIDIQPVVDGPDMIFNGSGSFLEDTVYVPDIEISGVDGGERAIGGVVIGLDGDSGGDLYLNGVLLTPDTVDSGTGDKTYNIGLADVENLSITARQHYSGPLTFSVTATSEDLTGATPLTKTTTETRTVLVEAVADVPEIIFRDDLVPPDPDTGQPYVDLTDPNLPVLTIVEDVPFKLVDAFDVILPDQDGSEIASVIIGSTTRPVPDYAVLTAPPGSTLINNGDGTYTVGAGQLQTVSISLRDEHARTPDEFDSRISADIPLSIKVITYELSNADEAEAIQDFVFRVRPDADVPTVAATIDPTMGTEDDPDPYEFTISGNTPDQHEDMSFEISNIPAGGKIFVGTTEITVTGGVAVIDSKPGASIPGLFAFEPVDTVTFVPPADFAGNVAFEVRAITIDSTNPGSIFLDTEPSTPANVVLEIEVAPDLVVTVDDTIVEFDETDAVVPYKPYDGFTIEVTDNEASGNGPEFVDSITYTLTGVPSNIMWSGLTDPSLVTVTNNVLTFSATGSTSQAEFEALVLEFPRDFSTESRNDLTPGPLAAELNVTTNEYGDETVNNQIDIGKTEDLDFVVVTRSVVLTETDVELDFAPSTAVQAQATDIDGSESSTIDLVIENVPPGTKWSGTGVTRNGNDLEFSGDDAEYAALIIHFPANWASNGTPLDASINVTTNEDGANSATFTIEANGTPDVSATVMPIDQVQTGNPITLDLGVVVEVTPTSAAAYEWVEEVVINFDDPLPAGTTALPPEATLVGQKLTLSGGVAGNQPAFLALVSALAIVVPGDFVGDITGEVEASSNHGDLMSAVPFTATVADDGPPVITPPPVEINSTDAMFAVPFADLLTNATDADLPLDIQNVGSSDAQVQVSLGANEVLVTAPNGFVGQPSLTFDVVDAGGASSASSAVLDINTLQMVVVGTTTDPDSNVKDLLGDVTGGSGVGDIALGTAGDDGVVLSGSAPYADIEGFDLLGGSDFIDLSATTRGFKITLGDGDDWAIGGAGDDDISGGADNDILQGGGGSDILTGGAGQDVFVMTDLTASDVISDFDVPVGPTGVDQIDLTALVSLSAGEVLADQVDYDNVSGNLNVNGNTVANVTASTGGFAQEVEVIFNDASNAQATAII
ncbi:calcium-binding protein [Tateyamaria sp.]|uniref:calcium-binding protein n=1 Tax=Tateyamaria sp. TaxID=1929288 RepID=UPI00329D5A42